MTALIISKNSWTWGPAQTKAFNNVKEELSKNPTVLALYNPAAQIKLSADASSYGLREVLLQKVNTT